MAYRVLYCIFGAVLFRAQPITLSLPYYQVMLQRIYEYIYEHRLRSRIRKHELPVGLTLALTESDLLTPSGAKQLRSFVSWCADLGIGSLIAYIAVLVDGPLREDVALQIIDRLERTDLIAKIYTKDDQVLRTIPIGKGRQKVKLDISIGYGGKLELTDAIRAIMEQVGCGEIDYEDINSDMIESHLLFRHTPDLVIRAGGKHLTDFLIWQTIYSELYFTDVNFADMRRLDFLRIIRDYQKRQRRYGR
ncbi:MAG: Tritrans,polycis-undecaprenyl-diphosphate synthase (GGDP specific) [Candidatus Methanogaster sp.]|nr:MAG: Tritrans,polycis-undecaprenyl-diphosphate synthase (GGDP specific) [ANME-2 cluster archaeon]